MNLKRVMIRFADFVGCALVALSMGACSDDDPINNIEGNDTPEVDIPAVNGMVETIVVDGVPLEMVYVEGGTFQMGSGAYDDEKPIHAVSLSGFWIGKYEVSQKLWKSVMGTDPSRCKGDNLPVEQVSWDDAQSFIRRINEITGKNFRLPTEAEWEYAARGGSLSRGYKYSGSDDIDAVAWYVKNSHAKTYPVGTKSPNELGIHDMSGNVWEWCQDRYGANYYSASPKFNPTGPESGSDRVIRGGGWNEFDYGCLSTRRCCNKPDDRCAYDGLRLAL